MFATATVAPPPVAEPTPTAAPAPPPTATPVPTPKAGTPKLRSTRLAARRGTVKLQLSCSLQGPCAGTLAIRAGGRSLVRARRYSLVAGRPKTYTLALTRDARRTLARRRSLKVKVTLTPATGKAVTKTLRLRG